MTSENDYRDIGSDKKAPDDAGALSLLEINGYQ
jgi:hypothetical protein